MLPLTSLRGPRVARGGQGKTTSIVLITVATKHRPAISIRSGDGEGLHLD